MRKLLAVLVLLGGLAGCEEIATAAAGGDARIIAANRMSTPVTEVITKACASSVWGGNRLPAGAVIQTGSDRSFVVAPGCYDARLVGADGRAANFGGIELRAGQSFTATIHN